MIDLRKIIHFINKNKISIICIILVIIILMPMIYFFSASIINTDDFLYGTPTRTVYKKTDSVLSTVKEAIDNTYNDYFSWQGSFVSIFLMYMQPGIFSIHLYRIVLLLMFILSIICPYVLAFVFNKYYLHTKTDYIMIIVSAYIITLTQLMPSIFEAYYWFNGSIYYQFTLNLIFLFFSLMMVLSNTEKRGKQIFLLVILSISAILIGGSNYPLGLVFALILLGITGISFYKNKKYKWEYLILLFIFMTFFLINVLAPGNAVRGQSYERLSLYKVGLFSIRDMLTEMPKWAVSSLCLVMLCALSPIYKKITQNASITFINPLISFVIILLLLLTQYVPVLYGLGSKGPLRVENVRFVSLNIGLIIFFINAFGFYNQKKPAKKPNPIIIAIICSALVITSFSSERINQYTSYKMVGQISAKQFSRFKDYMDDTMDILDDPGVEVIKWKEDITNEFLHPYIIDWNDERVLKYYQR